MFNVKTNSIYNNNDIINPADLKRTIVVVDSRFRDSTSYSSTDFMMKLMRPYKNVIRLRLTSTEFPNVFYTFSEARNNVKFKVTYKIPNSEGNIVYWEFPVQIKTGNYTAESMRLEVQAKLADVAVVIGASGIGFTPDFLMELDTITARYMISDKNVGSQPFGLDFTETTLLSRTHDWGLGYYLGYRSRTYEPAMLHEAESFMDTNGNPNLYLELNDYVSCELNNFQNNINCFAIIIQKENKYFSIFGDEYTMNREINFQQPTNINHLKVRLFDVYGATLDMRDTDWTFTLEVTEVMNPRLYNFYKDYNRPE